MKKINKIVIYGDSISTREYGEGGYEHFLAENFGAEIVNYAVGASGLSQTTPDSTVSLLMEHKNIHEDADIVIMWHGTNEWYWGSEIGDISDEGADTFYGAVHNAVKYIREKSPHALFVWLTPIYRLQNPDGITTVGNAYEIKNKAGNTLEDYYRAIERASVRYGFPIIDMRRLCGIHETNHSLYLEDCVHPNRAGYERISRILIKALEDLLYYERGI